MLVSRNKKIKTGLSYLFLFLSLFVIFSIFPLKVKAVEPDSKTKYTLLAPLPGLEEEIDTKKSAENPCPFGDYLNTIIKITIGVCAVLAMIMIVWGGIQYMTSELASSKEAGKKSITQAVFGLLLALASYVILNTINPALLNACLNNVEEVVAVIDDSTPQVAIDGKYCTGTAGTNGGYSAGSTTNKNWQSIAGDPKNLPSGVVSNHPGKDCDYVGEQNCTSTRGLDMTTLTTIKQNCTDCGELTLTGGTECWLHGGTTQSTSHHPNSPTVDLRLAASPNLSAYIKSGVQNGNWYKKDGLDYLEESDHWHVGH